MSHIRVLLAEDHKIVREGTRQLLQQAPDLCVVGEAADGLEAVRQAIELCPDIVIMDVRLPEMNGIEATKTIKRQQPQIQVLILSAYDDDRYVFPLLEAGASGYLLKTSSGAELANAIRTVHAGATALDPRVVSKLINKPTGKQLYRNETMREGLTERELEVLRAAALGKNNKAIGDALSISPQTVQVHLRNIFGKLGSTSRAGAVAYAIGQRWLTLEPDVE
ncbi:MAG: response regulator transcription factor [Chloroflexi bacterium]|nr:response regulator transcription factor [Chloroflexota bacterium]